MMILLRGNRFNRGENGDAEVTKETDKCVSFTKLSKEGGMGPSKLMLYNTLTVEEKIVRVEFSKNQPQQAWGARGGR